MPGHVNGFALARMRRLDLKVLYMSAYEVSSSEAFGKILRKPIPPEMLTFEATSALARRGDSAG